MNVYDKIIEKYKFQVWKLAKQFFVPSWTSEDISQFLYLTLLQLPFRMLLNQPQKVYQCLRNKLLSHLRRKEPSYVYTLRLEQHPDDRNLISRVEDFMLTDFFYKKLKDLAKYLDEDELKMLRYFLSMEGPERKSSISNNSNRMKAGLDGIRCIPSDRKMSHDLGIARPTFPMKRKELYSKIYMVFKDFIDNHYIDK